MLYLFQTNKGDKMKSFTVLNYQGSKKQLIRFIHENIESYLVPNMALMDIFCGTTSVGYSFKDRMAVYANDSEKYASIIAQSLLSKKPNMSFSELEAYLDISTQTAIDNLEIIYGQYLKDEKESIEKNNINGMIEIYKNFPSIWKDDPIKIDKFNYNLFTSYYSGSYFGIEQSIVIDSVRYAIDNFKILDIKPFLFTAMFYAMKECVFSKDGHMAQPLDIVKNDKKLLKVRKKNIYSIFKMKLSEFFSDDFQDSEHNNVVYNMSLKEILSKNSNFDNVGVIYADPPYTDMQYSRYYHLLNTFVNYDFQKPTITSNGNFTKGLYTENRFQSELSQRNKSLIGLTELMIFSKKHCINLIISFAYPKNPETQKTDRYVMSIEDIVKNCKQISGSDNVEIAMMDYDHSNNRNSSSKKVIEYLVMCRNR